jgi:hypothetical protein
MKRQNVRVVSVRLFVKLLLSLEAEAHAVR